MRNDRYWKKVAQVNSHLKTLYTERNFKLLSHEKITAEKHLSESKLHLDKRGTVIFSSTIKEAVSNSIY